MTVKKLLQLLSTILVALVVLLAVALVGVRLAGIRTFTVLSGSMEPNYHVGSLINEKKVDPTTTKLGYVANYIQHPPGLYVAISAGAVLLLLTFLPDLLSGGSDKGQGKHIRQDSQKA